MDRSRCNEAREWIPRHAGGDLPPRKARKLEEHLAGCESCRAELDTFRGMRGVKPALISLRCRRWASPSRSVSMKPVPSKPSPEPERDKKRSERRFAFRISSYRETTQKRSPPVASQPGVKGCCQTGACLRSAVKISWGKPRRCNSDRVRSISSRFRGISFFSPEFRRLAVGDSCSPFSGPGGFGVGDD